MENQTVINLAMNELNENEKFGCSAGMFPVKIMKYNLDKQQLADIVFLCQQQTGVKL